MNRELDAVDNKLEQSKSLQSTFDKWAGNWLGFKKAKAHREAAQEISEAALKQYSQVKEVYQQEKYESLSGKWRDAGFVLCSDPSIAVNDLFDPKIQTAESSWKVDYSITTLDPEGWTYANSFAILNRQGFGDAKAAWNSYVRRRKWVRVDKKSATSEKLSA